MGFINLAEKSISAKLVYYGCGMGGKTTSLQAVHEIMCPRNEVQLVSINTEEDATLLFDFLPIDIGQVEGFKIKIQGFTVPGQPKYRRMRKYVLSGADAVVFVIDSESSRLEENLESFENLKENLRLNGLDPDQIPIVLQYNKRDLDDIISEDELDQNFKFRESISSFPSVATESRGVFEAFVHAAGMLVEAKAVQYGLGTVEPSVVADETRRKLWEICDEVRRDNEKQETAASAERIALTFDEEGSEGPEILDAGDVSDLPAGELFSDEELENIELGSGSADVIEFDAVTADEAEPEPALLDAAVESNLELVTRLGDLDRYKTLLERKNKELVQMTQNVVHDLNRPISAIRLMLSSMRKGLLGEIEERGRTAVDTGLQAIAHMERLVRDLMDSSRLDFDGVSLKFQEIDMALLVAQVVGNLRYEIEEHGVGVRIEPLPIIQADEWALTKAFMNLIGNAIQYHDPERPPRVYVTCEEREEDRVFSIRDNGIGVPNVDQEKLFRRFHRGENTGGISGTGLGLHIVREVVLGHGGSVDVVSEQGVGTTFFLTIPKVPVQPPHSALSEVEEASA